MNGNKFVGLFFFLFYSISFFAQPTSIYTDDPAQKLPVGVDKPDYGIIPATGGTVDQVRVEPPNWWVGMHIPQVEVLIYDQDIRDFEPTVQYPGVSIRKVTRLQNPNYLFVELEIGPGTKPGKFDILCKKGATTKKYPYELRARSHAPGRIQGLQSSDFIYLLMPDRFANGDPSNDSVEGMTQEGVNRDKMYFRHGGDLRGVIDKLDYLKSLGVTALWLNPVLENNQPYESYHGYAITDHYHIDRRFGSNDTYLELVEKAHQRGIKIIMDIVPNHVGDQHYQFKDLPDATWIHQFPEFTRTTYRAPTLMDPYASEKDRTTMSDGWFDHHMPDLNQQHPQVANYLTQSYLWWIEQSGHDAYRIDTYAYPDQAYMAALGKRLEDEYPGFFFFGETWVHGPAVQAQFTEDNHLREGYNAHMPGVTDFQLHYAISEALTREQGWTEGAARIYYTLAQDFLYEDPYRNVTFLDNHDLSRFFSVVGENPLKFKSALAFLLTTRGIPMIYYGTEIGMKNFTDPDGKVREDFPGGWEGDAVNKFFPSGRTAQEQEIWEYIQKLAQYRLQTPALQDGRLTQFVPVDGIYVYFRHDAQNTVMVVMNTHEKEVVVDTARFQERMGGFTSAKEVVTGGVMTDLSQIRVPGYTAWVLELR
ncbi:MAG: glycoside hydrolase family 13 protein [Saprospirales bacterium]|nr:glycoside hydrolase family 13 protein [Saprospirales bacterium]